MSDGLNKELSRRQMLTRIGAGAAIAWSAPVLSTIRTPAFAQESPRCADPFVCGQPYTACGTDPSGFDCFCIRSVEGRLLCTNDFFCEQTDACRTSADCPRGWICQAAGTGCCGEGVCAPPCGTEVHAAAAVGPTNAGR